MYINNILYPSLLYYRYYVPTALSGRFIFLTSEKLTVCALNATTLVIICSVCYIRVFCET